MSRGRAFVTGMVAALVLLGVAELVGGLLAQGGVRASPLAAIAGWAVGIAPAWARELAIAWFGTADKLVLVLAIGAAALAVGGLVGLVVRELAAGRRARQPADEPPAAPISRRRFLLRAGGAAVLGVLAAAGGAAMSGLLRAGNAAATALRLPTPARSAAPVPAAAELGIPGLAPVVTPNAEFYRVDTAWIVPTIAPEDWRLRIHGLVERELELDWAALTELDFEEFDVTLMCVSNPVGGPYIGNARWLGTRLRPLIERVAPAAEADMVLSTSSDGWTASTPLTALRDPDRAAILAVAMNGEPLAPEHGAPVRMVVPGLYGYVSATKWVVDLEVTRFDRAEAYWTGLGWAPRGPVKIESRIDVPHGGAVLAAGRQPIAGVAWYQHTGIDGVEVQVDDGPWEPAELAEAIGIDTWVQWRRDWDAAPGEHRLRVRAIGADGTVQTGDRVGTIPDGATGWHEVDVRVE